MPTGAVLSSTDRLRRGVAARRWAVAGPVAAVARWRPGISIPYGCRIGGAVRLRRARLAVADEQSLRQLANHWKDAILRLHDIGAELLRAAPMSWCCHQ